MVALESLAPSIALTAGISRASLAGVRTVRLGRPDILAHWHITAGLATCFGRNTAADVRHGFRHACRRSQQRDRNGEHSEHVLPIARACHRSGASLTRLSSAELRTY